MSTFPQDDHETPVLFRFDHGAVTAVFPTLPADLQGRYLTCYAHIGQHGSCSLDWLRRTRPATEAEYADLRRELEGAPYGYRLKVYARRTHDHRETFNAEVRRMARPQARFA